MLEKHLQKNIIDYLNKEPETYVMKTIIMNMRGMPDILICHRGYFIYIEVKKPGVPPRVSKLQKKRMEDLDNSGAYGFVTNSFDEFILKWLETKRSIENYKNPCGEVARLLY